MAKDTDNDPTPRHVAIIMDGNGRWAKARGRPRLFGHHAGARRVREIVESCPELGVKYLTIFAFSTENWKRTQVEVSGLMALFKKYLLTEIRDLCDNGVRVRFIGDRIRLEPALVSLMNELEEITKDNSTVNLTVALNYGGRDEVFRATKRLAQDVADGKLSPDAINEETLPKYLDTHFLPDPDLVIRTSGEARISGFLLWQSAYAEYEFIDTFWPDFTPDIFEHVLRNYGKRERRFGAVRGFKNSVSLRNRDGGRWRQCTLVWRVDIYSVDCCGGVRDALGNGPHVDALVHAGALVFRCHICDCFDLGHDHRQRNGTGRGYHHRNPVAAGLFSYGGHIGDAGVLGHHDWRTSFDPSAHGNGYDRNTMDHRIGRDHGYCGLLCRTHCGGRKILACV